MAFYGPRAEHTPREYVFAGGIGLLNRPAVTESGSDDARGGPHDLGVNLRTAQPVREEAGWLFVTEETNWPDVRRDASSIPGRSSCIMWCVDPTLQRSRLEILTHVPRVLVR